MSAEPPPLCDVNAERGIIGLALMASGRVTDAIFDRVSPDDFYNERCREIAFALLDLREEGHDPDWRAIVGRLRARGTLDTVGGDQAVEAMTADGANVGALARLCDDVADLGRGRRRLNATYGLQAAIYAADEPGAWDQALGDLHASDTPRHGGGWATPDDVAALVLDSIGDGDRVRWPWPMSTLNHLSGGGARRGQLTFIGGASSHGKSVLVDLALQSMADAGATTALFLNEMTIEERGERMAANLASVRYSRIQQASAGLTQLTPVEAKAIVKALADQKVAMCRVAGWSVEQIIREARRRKLDVMALDIIQKLPFQAGVKRHQTIEDAVQRLDAYAKDTGCHVIIAGQINRDRANGTFPVPGLADIKDCAELGNGPDNVLFVWREQDPETLDPLDDGVIRMGKYRGARLETIKAGFVGEFQRWTERSPVHGAAA